MGRFNPVGILAGCALLASPAIADDTFDANAAWALFTETCGKILAAPEGAPIYALAKGGTADAAATTDAWGLFGSIAFPDLQSETAQDVMITYGAERYPDGTFTYCMLQTFGDGGPSLPGIFEIAASRAGDVLGEGFETFGGRLLGGKVRNTKALAFKAPGFPPEKIVRIQQFDRITILNMGRMAARKED